MIAPASVAPDAALTRAARLGSAWRTDFGDLPGDGLRRALAGMGELGFTTSGTSGSPVTWIRDDRQLVMEAEVTTNVLGNHHDAVHSTVPPESLYGYVALIVAARLRVPYLYDRWGIRRLPLSGRHPLVFSIPPTWQTLPTALANLFRTDDSENEAISLTTVHAGARLPGVAWETVDGLRDRGHKVRGLELFGASETGLIAWREFSATSDAPWNVVADTELVSTGCAATEDYRRGYNPEPLTVRGPRLGRRTESDATPDSVTTGDLITTLPGGTLQIVGRSARRIKPGGRWVDLDHLDSQIRTALPDLTFLTISVDDQLWGEHVELLVDPRAGVNPDTLHQQLRLLGEQIDIVPIRVRADAELDRSPMGKVRLRRAGHGPELAESPSRPELRSWRHLRPTDATKER